jgi:thioesterase domain-containing protein
MGTYDGVFSYGMDVMVDKCKARGITASAHGHREYTSLASEAAQFAKVQKGRIVIIGHSLGADAAVYMADEMKKLGAPVALLVLFGPTVHLPVPSNVRSVVNYYQTTSLLWRGKVTAGSGFNGSIKNVNLDSAEDVTHFNIEKLERLPRQAMLHITGATRGTGRVRRDQKAGNTSE